LGWRLDPLEWAALSTLPCFLVFAPLETALILLTLPMLVAICLLPKQLRAHLALGQPPTEDLQKLRDPEPLATQLLVDVVVLSGDVPIGEDSGVLAFVDGWLVFMGQRSEFCLGRHDVVRLTYQQRRRIPYVPTLGPKDYPICLWLTPGSQRVGIVPRQLRPWSGQERTHLHNMVERWAFSEGDPSGVTVLPPSLPATNAEFYAWLIAWSGIESPLAVLALTSLPLAAILVSKDSSFHLPWILILLVIVALATSTILRRKLRSLHVHRTYAALRTEGGPTVSS
jgi:hypothetical protein